MRISITKGKKSNVNVNFFALKKYLGFYILKNMSKTVGAAATKFQCCQLLAKPKSTKKIRPLVKKFGP
jgi:hypothetical protein